MFSKCILAIHREIHPYNCPFFLLVVTFTLASDSWSSWTTNHCVHFIDMLPHWRFTLDRFHKLWGTICFYFCCRGTDRSGIPKIRTTVLTHCNSWKIKSCASLDTKSCNLYTGVLNLCSTTFMFFRNEALIVVCCKTTMLFIASQQLFKSLVLSRSNLFNLPCAPSTLWIIILI